MFKLTQRLLCIILIAIPLTATCQTGLYLTYPCADGSAVLKKFDPKRTKLCLTPHPILTIKDIASISSLFTLDRKAGFEIRLTREGFDKARTTLPLSTLVVFLVDDEILFVHEGDQGIQPTILVYQPSDVGAFQRLHQTLKAERGSSR